MIRFCDLHGDPVSLELDQVSHAQPDGSHTLIVLHDGRSVTVSDAFEVVAEVVWFGESEDGNLAA